MDTPMWIMLTNALVWLGIGGYMAFLANNQAKIAKRLKQMEMIGHE